MNKSKGAKAGNRKGTKAPTGAPTETVERKKPPPRKTKSSTKTKKGSTEKNVAVPIESPKESIIPEGKKLERSNSFISRGLSKLYNTLAGSRDGINKTSSGESLESNDNVPEPPVFLRRSRTLGTISLRKHRPSIPTPLEDLTEETENRHREESPQGLASTNEVSHGMGHGFGGSRESLGNSILTRLKRTFSITSDRRKNNMNSRWSASLQSLQQIDNMVSYEDLSFINYDEFNHIEKQVERALSQLDVKASSTVVDGVAPPLKPPEVVKRVKKREKRVSYNLQEKWDANFDKDKNLYRQSLDTEKLQTLRKSFRWSNAYEPVPTEYLQLDMVQDPRGPVLSREISLDLNGKISLLNYTRSLPNILQHPDLLQQDLWTKSRSLTHLDSLESNSTNLDGNVSDNTNPNDIQTVLDLAPTSKVRLTYQSGSKSIPRPLSSGKQTYDTIPANYPLTQPIMKIEGLIQCSGEAEYINDIYLHNALWATFVTSKDPLKTIMSIDATAALAVKGVRAFYSAEDIPGVNSCSSQKGPILPLNVVPEEVFCSGKVLYYDQPVGVIVADEMSQAVYAADLVKIQYASQKNTASETSLSKIVKYFTGNKNEPEEILLPTLQDVWSREMADVQNRFRFVKKIMGPEVESENRSTTEEKEDDKESKTKKEKNVKQLISNISGKISFGPQYHYHMETQTTLAEPVEDGMNIYPSTQWIDFTQRVVAQVLGVKESTINIRYRRLGGAFGGKIFRNGIVACAAAVACYHINKPVRVVLPMRNNMRCIGKRMPSVIEYNAQIVDLLSTVLLLNANITHDIGVTANDYIMLENLLFSANAYVTLNWIIQYNTASTDAPTNTWMRAPGSLEMIAHTETVMDHIAWKLKKDPIQVRLANIAPVNPIRNILTDFLVTCDYYQRLSQVDQYNKNNRWKKRGIAVSLMQYPHENLGNYEALVSIYHADGSVALNIAGIEMGQGLYTKITQIAAFELDVPIDKIRIVPPNNVVGTNSMVTAGSFTTDTIGYAVIKCCEILKARLEPLKLLNPTGTWEEIVQAAYLASIELIATFQFTMLTIPPYIIYGVACAEIEIDVLTGNFQLRRVDIVEDTGESISPRIDVGQVEGAFIMGVGYWLHEKLIYNRQNGELLTDRAWNYKPPGAKDIPVDFRVTLLQKSSNPLGVLRSKVTSEPAITLAVVVISALRKALESARKDAAAPDIFLVFNSGTTVDTILELAATKNSQFIL